jgi:phosphatidylglycerophosphate synthase
VSGPPGHPAAVAVDAGTSPGCPLTDGERWTRAELEALRAARFSPGAVLGFLRASQRRADETRAARPELARQERAWLVAGALAYGGVAASGNAGGREGGARVAAWWGTCALMLDWHLGMLETPEGVPRRLGPADALTLTRAWLVPLVARDPAPALLVAGWATDVLDGVVARATSPTRAGRDLEGLVDACFAMAALAGLRRHDRIGAPAAAAEAGRIAVGTMGATAVWFGRAQPPPRGLLRAGRGVAAVRAAGMLLAARGRRREGGRLLAAGSAASVGLVVVATVRG